MPSSLPFLFPAGNLAQKTPIKNGPILGDQSTARPHPNIRAGDLFPMPQSHAIEREKLMFVVKTLR
jgi:hypothetical protein